MLHSSIPVGRFFGVELRVHISFPILLLLAIAYSEAVTQHAIRGIALWIALVFAVLVREAARSVAAAYSGLRLRALFLLPVGGIMAFAPRDRNGALNTEGQWDTRAVTAAGPIANFFLGLVVLGSAYALDPHVTLLSPPWITTSHILRSMIWSQFILGAVSLLPASLLNSRDLGSVRQKKSSASAADAPTQAAPSRAKSAGLFPRGMPSFNFGTALALVMIVAGLLLVDHPWLVILGGFMFLYSQLGTTQSLSNPAAASILVADVMLTEYTLLSTTDTLQGALDRTVHSLQDVFPIVRGDRLVGSVARQTISDRLLSDGDSYLQGIMTRTLQIATPTEKLVEALRRAANLGASEFIPVVEDGALLGILTPQSLGRAAQHISTSPRTQSPTRDRS